MKLKAEDAAALIKNSHSEKTILVGGQAVSFWAAYYGIGSDLPILTNDIDYLGTATDARRASAALPFRHKLRLATLSDATPNTAMISVELDGYDEPVLIDYLAQIIGLETKQVQRSAVLVDFEGASLQVIHPVLLLQSKVSNLYQLKQKRTPEGREQARLAIVIVSSFLSATIASNAGIRDVLKIVEVIGKFSATAAAIEAQVQWGLDCLSAIPAKIFEDRLLPPDFYEKRWPQIRKMVNAGVSRRQGRTAWRAVLSKAPGDHDHARSSRFAPTFGNSLRQSVEPSGDWWECLPQARPLRIATANGLGDHPALTGSAAVVPRLWAT